MNVEKRMGRKLSVGIGALILAGAVMYFYFYPQEPVPRAASEVMQQVSDATITGKVESAFALSKRLSVYKIDVTTQTGAVTLAGQVPTEIDKELAETVAHDTTGVKQVINQLRVEPGLKPSDASLRESGRIADLEIQADLRERIMASPDLTGKSIQVRVQDRMVSLTGQVDTPAQKARVEQIARGLPNVGEVGNQLQVRNPAAPQPDAAAAATARDAEIGRQVGYALFTERENFRDVGAIKVDCKDGRVTLSGTVPSRSERALAVRIAREVKGAASINNQLQIPKDAE